MMPAWQVRPYRDGDEAVLIELYQRTAQRTITPEHWHWKLNTLPAPAPSVWLAFDEARLIFHYAGWSLRYHLPEGERLGMVSVDAMTDPDYRRRGLLSHVGAQAYAAWRAAGYAFTIGLPNEQWGSRAAALGWIELFPLQWLVRPIRFEAVAARRLRLKWPLAFTPVGALVQRWWNRSLPIDPTLAVRAIDRAGDEIDQVWRTAHDPQHVSIVRDSAWLNWRYVNAPELDYRVLVAERAGAVIGYLVFRLSAGARQRVGAIAEWLAPDEAVVCTLLRHALERLQAAQVDSVAALAIPGSSQWRLLKRGGFLTRQSFRVMINPFDDRLPLDELRDPDRWLMFGGDYDVL
jgi:hypothetical protein